MNFLPDSPTVSRPYCPECEPNADPTQELLDTRWCEAHAPAREGPDDPAVAGTHYLSGTAEAEAETCRRYALMLRKSEEGRESEKMGLQALRIIKGEFAEWEKSYRPRRWKKYMIPVASPSIPPLEPNDAEFIVCMGNSRKARELKEDSRRFYSDWEQVAAGFDKVHGVDRLARLLRQWQGNRAGTLILVTFAGIDNKEAPCVTCLAATT